MGMTMGRGAPPPAPGGQRWLGQPAGPAPAQVNEAPGIMNAPPAAPQLPAAAPPAMGQPNGNMMQQPSMPDRGVGPQSRVLLARMLMGR